MTLSLGDKTGQVLARVWERALELAETFEEGDVVKVLGEVEEYLGRLQVIVDKLRPAKEDEYELEDFLPHTERDIKEMLTDSDNPLSPDQPRLADDRALLHDAGKTKEFTYERDIGYSDESRLLGHVLLSERMITERMAEIPDFPPELALRLRHLVVSHHGRYEWGSPRRPKTLEACALHYIENLDAQINRFAQIIAARRDKTKPWTEYDTLLKRYLYAGQEEEELAIEEAGLLE